MLLAANICAIQRIETTTCKDSLQKETGDAERLPGVRKRKHRRFNY